MRGLRTEAPQKTTYESCDQVTVSLTTLEYTVPEVL